jgi:hypothetical protein
MEVVAGVATNPPKGRGAEGNHPKSIQARDAPGAADRKKLIAGIWLCSQNMQALGRRETEVWPMRFFAAWKRSRFRHLSSLKP